ncbi:hypothetical protein BCR34DRAFT_622014 [Clohesyomyces aquaticus]|uniref:Uncharacterized protein n=1 Tax=Clohesyomyces aquaticus TaxID=1231657 RepID=A0A1Y2A485_9PLEO|nr:hypothetical protein BCR34DRAFT_622014 [Clohesyomyces aquaticus]
MPWHSLDTYPLPEEDLVTFSFGNRDYDHDKPIYHDLDNPNRTLSWRQGYDLVRKLVAGFRAAGLQKGDCFSITSFNDIMYSMVFLGGVGAGGVFSGTNPAYRVHEIRHHIRTAHVKFFIVEPELLDVVLEGATGEGIPRDNIFVFNVRGQRVPAGFRSWEWLTQQGEEDWIRITDVEELKNTDVARLSTSGTTGLPKQHWEPRNLYPLPMFHVATVPAVHASPFRSGNKCWIMRRFEIEPYLAAIERLGITNLGMVPPLVIAIINSPLASKYSLNSVRQVGAGAAPLDANSQRRFQALCAEDSTFTQVMGMTETTGAISLFYWPEADETGSVGSRFMPNTDVKLVDDNGNDVTDLDVRGELCVRGPTVIRGYFNNDKANNESWDADGYFHTGDIIYCDGKSKLWYIVDRKKELIKVRGFQVAPLELEGLLLEEKDLIVDCAVIGVKLHPNADSESPRAYIVRKPGTNISADEVKQVIKEKLASYKQLTGGVAFVDEIPRSPSEKILKRSLREQTQGDISKGAKL